MKQFFKDFKEFAMRGNVVDMAVGVVIGTAFGKIVSSLVSDIIMPALSLITGRVSLQDLSFTLPTGEGMEPIVLKYGVFLQSVLDFLIIAFSIFVVIKLIGKLHRKKKEEAPEAPPAPTKEEVLLTEIRDLLAAQKSSAIANETEALVVVLHRCGDERAAQRGDDGAGYGVVRNADALAFQILVFALRSLHFIPRIP